MVIERRPLYARETDHERLWLSLALAGAALLLLWHAAGHEELPRLVCPFRFLTGIPCVACGGTRALLALGRGEVRLAFGWNPLVTLGTLAALVWLAYAALVILFRARRVRVTLAPRDRSRLRVVAWTLLLANWIFLIVRAG